MKNNLLRLILIGLLLSVLTAGTLAQGSHEAQLLLKPASFQDSGFLSVEIVLTNIEALYSVEMQLQYDPTQLEVRDDAPLVEGIQILPGPMFDEGKRVVVINSADVGNIKFVITLLNPAPAITTKEGTLANVTFQISDDSRPISVKVTSVKLISINLVEIPVVAHDLHLERVGAEAPIILTPQSTVTPDATIAFDATTQPTSTFENIFRTSNPFGLGIAIAGLILVVILTAVLIRSRQPSPKGQNPQPIPRKMPGSNLSAGRSSTLLIRQGNEAMAQSNFEVAYEYFSQAVELDPANAEAWLGKGLVAQQESEKRICLQRAQTLDPDNETVQVALKQLTGAQAS
jgi:hypothetical protein